MNSRGVAESKDLRSEEWWIPASAKTADVGTEHLAIGQGGYWNPIQPDLSALIVSVAEHAARRA